MALPTISSGKCRLERFVAVNGYDLLRDLEMRGVNLENDEILRAISDAHTRTISCGVLGCLLSHYFLLLHIHNQTDLADEDWVMIFEDDVQLAENTCERTKTLWETLYRPEMKDVRILFTGGRFEPMFEPSESARGLFTQVGNTDVYTRPSWGTRIHHPHDFDRGTFAYMIRKSVARTLAGWIVHWIRETRTVHVIDTFIYGMIEFEATYDVFPHLFYSPLGADSDIQHQPVERVI